jgi:3-hydroxybutyryl-CoA dehydratase
VILQGSGSSSPAGIGLSHRTDRKGKVPGMVMYEVGQSADMIRVITGEDILLFAEVTGDRNPVHISEEFAAKTRFGERIAHGILTAGLISAVIGMKLPGPGCLYLSQTLSFLAPVRIGDEITARAEIVEVISGKRLRLKTKCINQRKEVVLEGEAVVAPPRPVRGKQGNP